MLGLNYKEYREKIAQLKQQLETATEEQQILIHESLYNCYARMGLLLEAEKVTLDHIALLRKSRPKNQLITEELRLCRLLIDNGKVQQGTEHLDYALQLCSAEEVENKEQYISKLMGIYYALSMRDKKYNEQYNAYRRKYELELKPVTTLEKLDYYMELSNSSFNANERGRGLDYKDKLEKLLAASTDISDAYRERYINYLQQLSIGDMRTDPDQQRLINHAKEILEKNKREKFLPSAGVFFWLRTLANAYTRLNDIGSLKDVFNEMHASINTYVEENIDNKIYEQKYQSDYFLQEQKLKEAEELNKIKDSVFSNFNHELRTPLNIILSNCELITRDVELPVTGIRRMAAIQNQSYNLLNIIDQFIEINKTNLQFNKINAEVGDVIQFLQMLEADFITLCEQNNLALKFDTGKVKQLVCELDFAKLERILYNLITNAIKFTGPTGKVSVTLNTDKKKGTITLSVADTGIGIAKNKLQTIFKQFYSVSSDQQNIKTSSGFGIGLYLVKQLVDLMDGQISVDSKPAKGSTFKISLPVIRHTGKQQSPLTRRLNYKQITVDAVKSKAEKQTAKDNSKPLLLIVEDNSDLLEIISASLQDDFTIKTAGDGLQAKKLLDSYLPDVVITDLMMPHMNGIELTTHIKQHAALSHLPVIMLTAKGSLPNRIKGWQAGIDVFLRKPFSITEIQHCLQNIMQTKANAKKRIEDLLATATGKASKPETAAEKFIGSFKSYVLTNIGEEEIHKTALANHLKMDESSMYRKIKALTGYSPMQLVTRLKMLRAKDFLDKGRFTTLKEIAYSCGFNDPKYFSQVYKKEMGHAPKIAK